MYCTHCGIQIDNDARFCHDCGTATKNAPRGTSNTRELRRSVQDAKIAGVCAGVAAYFGLDVSLVRILWIVLTIYPPGGGLLAYIICWIVMPKEPAGLPAAMNPKPA